MADRSWLPIDDGPYSSEEGSRTRLCETDDQGEGLVAWEALEARSAPRTERQKAVAMQKVLLDSYMWALKESEEDLIAATEHTMRCREVVEIATAVLEFRLKELTDE